MAAWRAKMSSSSSSTMYGAVLEVLEGFHVVFNALVNVK